MECLNYFLTLHKMSKRFVDTLHSVQKCPNVSSATALRLLGILVNQMLAAFLCLKAWVKQLVLLLYCKSSAAAKWTFCCLAIPWERHELPRCGLLRHHLGRVRPISEIQWPRTFTWTIKTSRSTESESQWPVDRLIMLTYNHASHS